jgi:hypothetical protein
MCSTVRAFSLIHVYEHLYTHMCTDMCTVYLRKFHGPVPIPTYIYVHIYIYIVAQDPCQEFFVS